MGKTIKVGTMSGVVVSLSTTKGNCLCRNIRQRRAAMRLARTIFWDQPLQMLRNNATQGAVAEHQLESVSLVSLLKGRQVCPECVRLALLLQGNFHGESGVECALNVLHPLPIQHSHKK